MGLRPTPSQRQRRLGQELQRLREPSGLSAAEAGARIGVGRAHMSHIEAARTYISGEKVRILAEAYGCTRGTLVDELVAMAEASGRGWWSEYKQLVHPQLLDLAELENSATSLRTFEWLYVPGFLQTPAYTRSLFHNSDTDVPPELLDRYAEFRLRRQGMLESDPAPAIHAIIHESAFHMGFVDRAAMAEQLEFLIEAARSPNITIQLLPFSASHHPATPGSFTIFDARSPELRTVHVEQTITSVFLSERPQLDQFTAHFARLSNVALAPLDPDDARGEGSFGLAQYLLYMVREAKRVRS